MAKLSTTSVFGDLLVDGMIHGNVTGNLTGNASTATSATTATSAGKWTTARTLTIGSKGKTVDGSANVSWTLAEIGAAAASHGMHPTSKVISTGFDTAYRTQTKGNTSSGEFLTTIRNDTSGITNAPQYGSGLAWGRGDTHGYLYMSYSSAQLFVGAGNADKLNWIKQVSFSDHTHNYAAASHGTHVTWATAVPKANGTAAIGTVDRVAREDHVHPLQTSVSGNAGTATKLATARTITIGNKSNTFDGSANIAYTLADIGALALTGGTLSGRLTANGKITLPTTGSSWISGMTPSNASIEIKTQQSTGSYHPILAVKTASEHVANIGGLNNDFGFYGFKAGRTANATDWSFKVDAASGDWTMTGSLTSGGSIIPSSAITNSLGTEAKPWKYAYSDTYYVFGEASKQYGFLGAVTTGTTSATGETRLTLGNSTATGTASNSYGRIYMYGTSSGYTALTPGNNTTSNITLTLPSGGGTLARTSDNVATATKLQTARTINGTSFDGTANITTANWGTARNIYIADNSATNTGPAVSVNGSGNATLKLPATIKASLTGNADTATSASKWSTARTLTIGNTGKSVNGSANVSWTLAEIGAAASSHSHNSITYQDTRAVNTTAKDVPSGLSVHLKSNGTDGISDGGSYHPVLMMKPWGDKSGWPVGQLAVTQNNNLYFRVSSGADDTSWNAWKKVSLDGHTHDTGGIVTAVASDLTSVTINSYDSILSGINTNIGNL